MQPQIFRRHRGPVTCAAQIPNSNTIITSGYDNAVALFDTLSGEVSLLGYHQHLVNRVTVNQSGTLAASASSDYNVYIWDLKTSQLAMVLKGHDDDVEDFVFISDALGASVSRDWRIIIWDLSSGTIKRIILGHQKDVLSISYFDGKLYTTGDDMTLRIWDIHNGAEIAKIGPFENETDTCAIDTVNKRLVLGCDDGMVRVFDIYNKQMIVEIPGHQSAIKKVAVSPLTGDILSAAYDQNIFIWDANSFTKKQKLASHAALWERSFNWTVDGRQIVAGTFDGTVLLWDAESGECLAEFGADSQGNACFNDIASQGDAQLALVSDDGLIRVGELSETTARWQYQGAPQQGRVLMNAATFCPLKKQLITGAHNQHLHIFSNQAQELAQQLEIGLHEGPINSIRTSILKGHEGEMFVACYSGNLVHLDANGVLLKKIALHDNAIKALALHPELPIGVSCCAGGELLSWDYTGKILKHYVGHTAIVDGVDIDPSGRFIASAGRDFTLKIHGLEDGVLYHCIHLGRRSPKSLCFAAPDVVIVTNYWGELLRVSLSDGTIIRQTVAQNGISSITRHGEHFAAASYDGAVYLVEEQQLRVLNVLRSMTQQIAAPAFA
ncbi:WD40 repeat domain-containing protein [Undibacterium sp. Ji50W]|uniref:WD40 repeat domain-containing protein n=1 Tax=Undibacterium sp. Ji50W TaxID=3413041 RepID=UPI003BEF6F16